MKFSIKFLQLLGILKVKLTQDVPAIQFLHNTYFMQQGKRLSPRVYTGDRLSYDSLLYLFELTPADYYLHCCLTIHNFNKIQTILVEKFNGGTVQYSNVEYGLYCPNKYYQQQKVFQSCQILTVFYQGPSQVISFGQYSSTHTINHVYYPFQTEDFGLSSASGSLLSLLKYGICMSSSADALSSGSGSSILSRTCANQQLNLQPLCCTCVVKCALGNFYGYFSASLMIEYLLMLAQLYLRYILTTLLPPTKAITLLTVLLGFSLLSSQEFTWCWCIVIPNCQMSTAGVRYSLPNIASGGRMKGVRPKGVDYLPVQQDRTRSQSISWAWQKEKSVWLDAMMML